MMQYFRPRNWEKFQHYKDRRPTWIKLHTAFLMDHNIAQLTALQQLILIKLWLLFGSIGRPLPWDSRWIGTQLMLDSRGIGKALQALECSRFIELTQENDTETLAQNKSNIEKRKTPPLVPPQKKPTARAERGTRLQRDWKPDSQDLSFAEQAGFANGQVTSIAEQFRDYWIAQPGQRGVKLDWRATWRNWLRKETPKGERKTVNYFDD